MDLLKIFMVDIWNGQHYNDGVIFIIIIHKKRIGIKLNLLRLTVSKFGFKKESKPNENMCATYAFFYAYIFINSQ